MHIKIEQGINGCQVITDTYTNDLTGVQAVLNFLARQNRLLRKTLIVTHLWHPWCGELPPHTLSSPYCVERKLSTPLKK